MSDEHKEGNGRQRIVLDPTISGLVEELVVAAVERNDGLRTYVQNTIITPPMTAVSGDFQYDVAIVASEEYDDIYTKRYVATLEADGLRVFYPPRDIDGHDSGGGMWTFGNTVYGGYSNSREVHVVWHPMAENLRFYLGCCFTLGRPLMVVNPVRRTEGVSFQNFLLDWQKGKAGVADLAIHVVDFDGEIESR